MKHRIMKSKLIAAVIAIFVFVIFMPAAYLDIDLNHPMKGLVSFILMIAGFFISMFFADRETNK